MSMPVPYPLQLELHADLRSTGSYWARRLPGRRKRLAWWWRPPL
jgi:hypothetical protein